MIKVIYVGHELFGDNSATGHTLENIYCHCKNVDIRQFCLDYDPSRHVEKVPTWFISKENSRVFYCIKQMYRRHTTNTEVNSGSVFSGSSVTSHRPNRIVEYLKLILDLLPKRMSKESLQEIDQFHPDVILTLGENVGTLKIAYKLSTRYNAPIVLHIMDDIERSIIEKSSFLKRKLYLSALQKVYKKTRTNIAISEKMAVEFERRHNTPFSYAMNCINAIHPQPLPVNEKLRFVFSGGLHGGRGESLLEMAKLIMDDVGLSARMELVVYTSPDFVEQYKRSYSGLIELHEYVPREEMYTNLGKADVLVHVESFEQHEIDYFRYSMSTKIPEYLSVGRPMLCYGPREICTVSYIEDRNVGLVAETKECVAQAMRELVLNATLRKELGENALRVAESEHLAAAVAARVEDVFTKSIDLWRKGQC